MCVYVCIHVCICTCLYVCLHICTSVMDGGMTKGLCDGDWHVVTSQSAYAKKAYYVQMDKYMSIYIHILLCI